MSSIISKILANLVRGKEIPDADVEAFEQAVENGELSEMDASKADFMTQLLNRPEFKEMAAKQKNIGRLQNTVQVALQGADYLSSIRQIKQSDETLENLKAPTAPTVRGKDPRLEQSINEAGQRRSNIAQDPAMQEMYNRNLENFHQDKENSRVSSTGQAGSYGSNMQAAINRRYAADRAMLPEQMRMQQQADSRYDRLLQQQAYEQDRIQGDRYKNYGYQRDDYNRELEAAGNLGAVGRSNRRQAMGALAQSVPDALYSYNFNGALANRRRNTATSQAMNGSYNVLDGNLPDASGAFFDNNLFGGQEHSGFGPNIEAYRQNINNNLYGRKNPYNNYA